MGVLRTSLYMERHVICRLSWSTKPTGPLNMQTLISKHHFCFKIKPQLGNLTMDEVEDIFPTKEPRIHVPNVLPTHTTLHLDLDFILLSEPLFTYIVWIFLLLLKYPVAPPYLLSCGNEDTIFDPGISVYDSFMPSVSHRSGTFIKFNVYPNHLNERLPGFLKPLVLAVFVLRSQELHNPQLHLGIPIS
ncbi:hypothetical protein Tco_0577665 [Tanacetum coccineum]